MFFKYPLVNLTIYHNLVNFSVVRSDFENQEGVFEITVREIYVNTAKNC